MNGIMNGESYISREEHDKEIERFKKFIKRLQSKLDTCADWLETANHIIKCDQLSYDEGDDENCQIMIESCRKLANESIE